MLTNLLAGLLRRRRAGAAAGAHARTVALLEADRVDEAIAAAAAAVTADPREPQAHLALGLAWLKAHEPARALACCADAAARGAAGADLHDLRGAALQEAGRLDEALEAFEHALARDPHHAPARLHRGLLRLLRGDYARGWEDYEVRRADARSALHGAAPAAPPWDGSPLAGRALLVRREQGLGDEIMFASLVPELAAAGRVRLECDPRLVGLFARSFPGVRVGPPAPGERFDFEAGAASLARHLRRAAADFPRHSGYLRADPERVARWRARLSALGDGPAVGISWTGGVRRTRRALRSVPLQAWLPVLGVPGVRFVSLQYTPEAGAEIAGLRARHGLEVAHWPEAIDDYEETAALVCALDLVASVCTAVVHLAGALGRPAWVLTPFVPEWRYGAQGEGMPWYPSVRLFRQPAPGRWEPALAALAAALQPMARG